MQALSSGPQLKTISVDQDLFENQSQKKKADDDIDNPFLKVFNRKSGNSQLQRNLARKPRKLT